MREAAPGRPVALSARQYEEYRRRVDEAPDHARFEDIAGVVGSADPTAAALRGVLARYPISMRG